MSILSAIGSNTTNGPILPRIKYNAVKGRFYRIDREQTADGWQSTETAMSLPLKLAFDFVNMEVGQMAFPNNKPDFHMVRMADVEAGTAKVPAAPTAEHKTGVRVRVYNKDLGVREFMVQAKTALTALDGVYTTAKASPEWATSKVPVIAITGTIEVKFKTPNGGEGSSEQPVMEIAQWIDRKAFDAIGEEQPVPQAPAPKAPAAHVPPPAASDDTEF